MAKTLLPPKGCTFTGNWLEKGGGILDRGPLMWGRCPQRPCCHCIICQCKPSALHVCRSPVQHMGPLPSRCPHTAEGCCRCVMGNSARRRCVRASCVGHWGPLLPAPAACGFVMWPFITFVEHWVKCFELCIYPGAPQSLWECIRSVRLPETQATSTSNHTHTYV